MATAKGDGGVEGTWTRVESNKRQRSDTSLEKEGGRDRMKVAKATEELAVHFKMKEQNAEGFRCVNPLKVAESLKCVGEGADARILANGMIMLICRTKEQYEKAKKISRIAGKKVEVVIRAEKKDVVLGIVFGVCADMTEKEIMENVNGGVVEGVKRFKTREGGNPNAPVIITFEGRTLPARVYIGCLSFVVKEYKRPPLRCFKCQRYGHMAASCRGSRRCAKCGGDHDIQGCEAEQAALKCCNCGGSHLASSRECSHFVKAKQVQDVKKEHKISYAEALKRVEMPRVERSQPSTSGSFVDLSSGPSMRADNQRVIVNKQAFLAFIVDIVYATREKKRSSDIIQCVVQAAGRFLGVGEYSPQELHSYMKDKYTKASQESQEANNIERGSHSEEVEEDMGSYVGEDDDEDGADTD